MNDPHEDITLKNLFGEDLPALLTRPQSPSDFCVIICHGFGSRKEFKLLWHLANEISSQGFAALRFDFSNEGKTKDGEIIISHYDKQLHDLQAAISCMRSKGFSKIALVGHSLGGTLCLVTTSRDKEIVACATLSSPSNPREDLVDHLNAVEHEGEVLHYDVKLGPMTYNISKKFREDLSLSNLKENIASITCPLLFTHGDSDKIVPLSDMREIENAASGDKKSVIIEGANHLYRGHEDVSKIVAEWLQEKLH